MLGWLGREDDVAAAADGFGFRTSLDAEGIAARSWIRRWERPAVVVARLSWLGKLVAWYSGNRASSGIQGVCRGSRRLVELVSRVETVREGGWGGVWRAPCGSTLTDMLLAVGKGRACVQVSLLYLAW